LKGLKVGLGCTGGCGADIQLARGLEKGGLTLMDVDLVQMPFPNVNVALANKALDAGLQVEPFISIGEAQGVLVRWKKGQDFYPGHQAAVYLYSPAFMEKNPDVAKRFMVGFLKGKRDFFEAMERGKDKEAIDAIIVKNTALKDAKLIDKMREIGVIGAVDPDGYVNADSIKYDMDWIVAQGYMPSAPLLKDVVDNQWVDYAVQQLGRYK
jgi:NitT/TauT family transport system substrate-binding protein